MIGTVFAFVTGSKLGRYFGFAMAMIGAFLMLMIKVRKRDARLLALAGMKSQLKRQKKLNVIHKKQADIAANRISGDDLIDELRDQNSDF